ncbi:MAG: preprotein translocase subunit SecA [Holosporales bacterium]|jgi:preprotein translocase subunit SecA|nr:preprotein translocase subunit SecA [Holosporales bacterium]
MFLIDSIKKLVGSRNERIVKQHRQTVKQINVLEPEISRLNDDDLKNKTAEFKKRLENGETLENLLPEAFAVVREASVRTLGMRPFDVQLIGGMVLHEGKVAEMKTGEGKTLVATLPVYLNALAGNGVHVVTVNDYLAKRDAQWMGKIYEFLGLSVGVIVNSLDDPQRRDAYNADITYATNNELGFDYLRDNMKFYKDEFVQRPFHYAIVDEVDSILIDEARTPLIISGQAEDSTELYRRVDKLIPQLLQSDYEIDLKQRQVTLTETGNAHIEEIFKSSGLLKSDNLYDFSNMAMVHHMHQALKAHFLFRENVDYIVKDGQIIIIDEFTGRMMEGRRYSEGLHQALEAKENVHVQMENQTLASITFQNFFRMYPKLAGMTGTAETEAAELMSIYKLDTIVVPTNVPIQRKDLDDEIYRTEAEKFEAIVNLVKGCLARGQPALIGTTSIEKSEQLSEHLKKNGIKHNVLNARYHEMEAQIIAEAGRPGAVTIATNMAGRGTDIKLGGNLEARINTELAGIEDAKIISEKTKLFTAELERDFEIVKQAGGLYIIGTERHESRRIDNQLRGRSGRQGDPGGSKFFLSLQDDLMRIFGSGKLDKMLLRLGLEEGEAIAHPWVNKAIEKAQGRVEARNYDIRKHLLKYDDVMNEQRKVIYTQRKDLILNSDPEALKAEIADMRAEIINNVIEKHVPDSTTTDQWNLSGLAEDFNDIFGVSMDFSSWQEKQGISRDVVREQLTDSAERAFKEKEDKYTPEVMCQIEKSVMLQIIDKHWKEHLLSLDWLRQGINLRAYGQRDPLNEYKTEAFNLFELMSNAIRAEAIRVISKIELSDANNFNAREKVIDEDVSATDLKPSISRNSLCHCGSGRKYKHCHGKI